MALKYLVDIDLNNNELQNAALHTVSTLPAGFLGQIVYDTNTSEVKLHDGTNWFVVGKTYSAGNGISLAGTTFSVGAGDGLTQEAGGLAVNSTVVRTTGAQTIAGNKTFSNNVIVNGDLTVSGTTTTINTETLNLADNIITLNSNAVTATENAGIEVYRAGGFVPSIQWDEAGGRWTFTNDGAAFNNIPIDGEYAPGTVTSVAVSGSGGITVSSGSPITTSGTIALTINDSAITNAKLANSAITINGTSVSLGGSINVGDITAVSAGSGLTGGGTSGAVTLTNAYIRTVTSATGLGDFYAIDATAFVLDTIEVTVKEVGTGADAGKYLAVMTDWYVDTAASRVYVWLEAVDYKVTIGGVRA